MAKILLLDGNSLSYRAFFALPTDMATASGQVTNAVFGFTSMLQYLLNEHRPEYLIATFDRPEPTFRHEAIADYKAGRAAAPDILRQQMGLIRQVVDTLDIPTYESVGFEADDVIATLAELLKNRGDDVIIVTGDRDSYQLVEDPHVRVLYNKRGVSDYALYDEAGIIGKTGVHPTRYAQYAALRGDPSDNLAGVPGVGEKTAAKLINDYGDLAGIYENLAKCTPKLRENLAFAYDMVMRNASATPLVRDVPGIDLSGVRTPQPDVAKARELFNFLEFRTMSDRVLDAFATCFGGGGAGGTERGGGGAAMSSSGERLHVEVTRVSSPEEVALAGGDLALAARWAGAEARSALFGVALASADGTVLWVPAEHLDSLLIALGAALGAGSGEVLRPESATVALPASSASPRRLHGHRLKELLRSLHDRGLGLEDTDAVGLDTAVAGYLLDPADGSYPLEALAQRYAGIDLRAADAPPEGQFDLTGQQDDPVDDCARRAYAVSKLVEPLEAALSARGLKQLYDDIERPLIGVLARMEAVGVRVDTAYLKELAQSLTAEARLLEEQVQEIAGERFLVNSVPQLRAVLFDKLQLKTDKKTKTGYSTDAQSLEKLRGSHPIIEPLLRYREVEKLRSTYGESLLNEVASDGRIHASFNQTVARTGRLSSDQPNLHNIPIRSEEGRRFRRAFIPADGCELLVADYNQIELRVIAHLAQDPGLIEAFTSGTDIHNATASRVFDVEPGAVTLAQRSKAKMVSYGLAYGMESYGLAQRLNIAEPEARQILTAYFEAFPNVKQYMERAVAEARNKGFTETLFGRRRQIPELQSPNYRIRQMGERQAMNAGIQGLAADIFKVALVRLDAAIRAETLRSRLILQVHDEVILEVPPDEHDRASRLTIDVMRDAAVLDVPLEVNISWGPNWADAKG